MSRKNKHKAFKHKLKQEQYKNKVKESKEQGVKVSESTPVTEPVKTEQESTLIIDLPDDSTTELQNEQDDPLSEPLSEPVSESLPEPLPESKQSAVAAEVPESDKDVNKSKQTNSAIQAFVSVVGIILVMMGVYYMVQMYNDAKESVETIQTQEQVSDWEELYNEVEQESIRQDLIKETHDEEELVDIEG